MSLTEYERKYLARLETTTFCESDKYFKAALPTLRKLHSKGLVRRVDLDGNEYEPEAPADADCYWELGENCYWVRR